MYSHEILELLKLKKKILNYSEYLQVINSPQIDHIKYENDTFNVWTKDGYSFSFRLVNKEK